MRIIISLWMVFIPFLLSAHTPEIRNREVGIELCNERSLIILSKNAELVSIIDLKSNKNIAAPTINKIAYIKTKTGDIIEASKLVLEDESLYITIGNHIIQLKVQAFKDYFTVEVENSKLPGVDVLTFLDLKLNTNLIGSSSFWATGVALSLQTNPVYYPSLENKAVIGQCTTHTGLKGSKLAIIASPKEDLWDVVKNVYRSIPSNNVPVVLSSGGPFAHDCEANRQDCVILGGAEINPENVHSWIEFYSNLGVKQIDFLLGPQTFIQGQFTFPVFGSPASFKKLISDPLQDAGIISSLHTYAYYISYSSHEILSNPKWQQQLEFRGEHKLSNAITPSITEISVEGDISYIKSPGTTYSVYTPYLLIDNEIIRYTIGKGGFVSCKRGQCGTIAAAHNKNAIVRVIGGYFNYIAPQIGSELYYEIARRTAVAYNEGGFKALYFDALDGLGIHLKYAGINDYLWYYGAAFVNEVLKYCESEPLVVEFSHLFPAIWPARGRGECWDYPTRGYKKFIDLHTLRNNYLIRRQYIGSLGWYNFYPRKADMPGNYSTKYMFSDDVDYLGVKAIAYDQTIVYNGLLKKHVEDIPALKRNLELYSQYNRLRTDGYFTEKVKEILKKGSFEYKLSLNNGVWGFYEAVYCRTKLRDIKQDSVKGVNPFERQKPFIRFENLYSTDCSSVINLIQFNDKVNVMSQKMEDTFVTPLDLSQHLALKVSIEGNGKNSGDVLCIRLKSSESSSGYADYIVHLNFEGWREILLPNLDNGEYPNLNFKEVGDERYKMHRYDVDYSKIKYIELLNSGRCEGVKIRSIDAVPLVDNPIKNPTIHIGNSSIKFLDTIQSGEYIEYQVGKRRALVFDSIGNNRTIKVRKSRKFRVPNGEFAASVSGEAKINNAPTEVVLTFGLSGEFIHN